MNPNPSMPLAGQVVEPDVPHSSPLRGRLVQCLHDRNDRPQVSMLRRSGPPRDLSGHDLRAAAASLIAKWQDWFGPGPHTLVLALPQGEAFLSALLAGLLGGHTLVPVAPPRSGSRAERLQHIAQDCAATAVLCSEGMRDIILQHLRADGSKKPVCPVATLDGHAQGPDSIDGQASRSAEAIGPVPAVIQYTSGSTRLPKGVRIFGEQIIANCDLVARTWGMSASTRFVNWLPHYHDMGLMGGILYPLLTGAYSAQMNPLDMVRKPVSWLRAISDCHATFSGGPAFAFADCLRRIEPDECEGLDLSSWSRAFCGAEPIPAGLLPSFRNRFAPYGLEPGSVFGCYGMAEMTLFAAGAPVADDTLPPPAGCSAVHPCLLTDTTRANVRVVDPDNRMTMNEGQQGEIWLRGPSKGQGYINLPEETAATFNAALAGTDDGAWLRTGDLGAISGDLLYVTGRLKDTLIANGRKIAASELEWLAASLDDALNPLAAAAFMPSHVESAVAVLLIELKPGHAAPACPETVRATIERATLGEWGIRLSDLRILPRGKLERTSSGKIRRQAAATAYRQGLAPPAYDSVSKAMAPA
jgi:acyl-CoA synthetase (AMP-forming)/AMP-acid ligase II